MSVAQAKKLVNLLIKNARRLKSQKKLRMGITNIIRVPKCPLQGILYSNSLSPLKKSVSKAYVIGALSHKFFEIYYDMPENTSIQWILDVARTKMNEGYYADADAMDFYEKYKDEIDTRGLKYFETFRKWAKSQPLPWLKERYLVHGIVHGSLDRGDRFSNKWWITDYKTSDSKPTDEMLEQYKRQIGGYCYLGLKKFPELEMVAPEIVVFKKRTWNTYIIDDWKRYVEDFEGILEVAAGVVYDLAKGKIPEAWRSQSCAYCVTSATCDIIRNGVH